MAELMLPPATHSVPMARRFAREQLRESACDVDTVVLLVSEVVTNAVLHGRSDLRLRVDDRGDTARVEVADSSAKPVRVHEFGVESTTGRGLHLVAQLSLRWGAEPGANGWGKVVWFEVGAPSAAAWESFADSLMAEGAAGDL